MRQNFKDLAKVATERYNDKNFCTVAALALSLDWSYGKAQRHMKKYGRRHRCGMHHSVWYRALKDAVKCDNKEISDLTPNGYVGMTISRFTKERRSGTFYVRTRGHALCIRDGVMHDWTADTAGRRRIINVYKVEG